MWSSTPSPRTINMGASSVERSAVHTVVTTSESSGSPSFAETSIRKNFSRPELCQDSLRFPQHGGSCREHTLPRDD